MAQKIPNPRIDAKLAAEEITILAPDRHAVIGGRSIKMREPSWMESLEFDGPLQPIIEELRALQVPETVRRLHDALPIGIFAQLLARYRDVLYALMAFCAEVDGGAVDVQWIDALPHAEGQQLMALFWAVNEPLFRPTLATQSQALRSVSWPSIFADLIAAGHSHESLKGYTRRQMRLFYEADLRRQRRKRADRVEELALARGSGKELERFLKLWRSER
jgi:hypothetical protein